MRRLPLFPLPVVLFPGATMPLHIFEPRYRQMMAHCLERDRRFGLVFHDPDRAGSFCADGQIGCTAEILKFQPIPDGRSLVLVRGGERFRVEDGIESEALYYEGLVEDYADQASDRSELLSRRRDVAALFGLVVDQLADAPPDLPPIDTAREASFQIAQWVRVDAWWQHELLSLRSEAVRLERIHVLLRSVLEQVDEPGE